MFSLNNDCFSVRYNDELGWEPDWGDEDDAATVVTDRDNNANAQRASGSGSQPAQPLEFRSDVGTIGIQNVTIYRSFNGAGTSRTNFNENNFIQDMLSSPCQLIFMQNLTESVIVSLVKANEEIDQYLKQLHRYHLVQIYRWLR